MVFDAEFITRLARRIREIQVQVRAKQERNLDLTDEQILSSFLSEAFVKSSKHDSVSARMFADDFNLYATLMAYLCSSMARTGCSEVTTPQVSEDTDGALVEKEFSRVSPKKKSVAAVYRVAPLPKGCRIRLTGASTVHPWTGSEIPDWLPRSVRVYLCRDAVRHSAAHLACSCVWSVYCGRKWCPHTFRCFKDHVIHALIGAGILHRDDQGALSVADASVKSMCDDFARRIQTCGTCEVYRCLLSESCDSGCPSPLRTKM